METSDAGQTAAHPLHPRAGARAQEAIRALAVLLALEITDQNHDDPPVGNDEGSWRRSDRRREARDGAPRGVLQEARCGRVASAESRVYVVAVNRRPRSLLVEKTLGSATGPTLVLHGDPDDYLRAGVVLASIAAASKWGRDNSRAVAGAKNPATSLTERASHIRQLLSCPRIGSLTIVDLDALPPRDAAPVWDDSEFANEREWLYQLLLQAAAEFGSTILRPNPTRRVSDDLYRARIGRVVPDETDALISRVEPMELRPLARALLARGMSRVALAEALEVDAERADRRGEVFLDIAFGSLTSGQRATLRDIALIRISSEVNGALGPLAAEGYPDHKGSFLALAKLGLVDAEPVRPGDVVHWRFRVPRVVREYVSRLRSDADPVGLRETHRTLGLAMQHSAAVNDAHHHAGLALDEELGVATAVNYSNDLRTLGTSLSRRAEFARAVNVFRAILQHDPKDAYAHEYLAYNLLRDAQTANRETANLERRVMYHYQRAHALENDGNPLFHGRWLGYRAAMGQPILDEVILGARRHTDQYGAVGGSYFLKQIDQGLRRGGQVDTMAQLMAQIPLYSEVRRNWDPAA